MSLVNCIDFKVLGDHRGQLVALEENRNVPFDIKRIYYIFGTPEKVERGFHAHHKLKQLLICVHGECTFVLDNGLKKEEIHLATNNKGLLIEPYIWHEMKNFSKGAVLLALASEFYDESDYIRDYETFLKVVRK
jgi:dTDP-4-dehydrorhamnose 3,5-epimerase-like enzyme